MGQYRVMRKLAEGGMAEVLLGKLVGAGGFEKPVAIKRMLPEVARDPANAAAFLQEARLCVHLSHPNVVQVLDLGTARGQPFLVMELVDGEDLRKVMRAAEAQKVPLDLREALHITVCVAEALAYAFDAPGPTGEPLQVVHRDVNPCNVLVSMRGEVKLADFGVAKAADGREATQGNVVKGKLQYLAPEVLLTGGGSHASDVFLAGALLFELVCGRQLFASPRGAAPGALLAAIAHHDEAKLELPADLPAPLAPVLRKALARAPEARHPHARELAAELRDVIEATGLRLSARELASRMAARFPGRPRLDAHGPGELLEEPPPLVRPRPAPPVLRPAGPAPLPASRPPQPSKPPQRLGELLVAAGVITAGQLNTVLARQRAEGGRLAEWVVNLEFAAPGDVLPVLAKQLGLRWIDDQRLAALRPEPELLARFNEQHALRLMALPLAVRSGQVLVATSRPNDIACADELRFILGTRVLPALASELGLRRAIAAAFAGAPRWRQHDPVDGGIHGTRFVDFDARPERTPPQPREASPVPAVRSWPPGMAVAYVQTGIGPDGAPILVPMPMAALSGTPPGNAPVMQTPPPATAQPVEFEALELEPIDDSANGG